MLVLAVAVPWRCAAAARQWVDRLECLSDHWLPGFNFNVEEWFEGDRYETPAICRSPWPTMIRHRIRVVRSGFTVYGFTCRADEQSKKMAVPNSDGGAQTTASPVGLSVRWSTCSHGTGVHWPSIITS
jgi:hypothetical protein